MEGKFIGRRMIPNIEQTTYGTLEEAIRSKTELVEDLKEHFGWTEKDKDVAFNLGIIDGLKTGLPNGNDNREETGDLPGDPESGEPS